jgi:crotonobetainyl-CoA:carnitine CoA-transferase CaiB-like acyl-CoA transferase
MSNTYEHGTLNDLKVIELSNALAGPIAAMFFAELGAEVKKYENRRTGGDVTRRWRKPDESGAISSYYASVNYGKEILTIDLRKKSEHAKLWSDLRDADLLITNFKPGSAEKLGLGFEELRQAFPSLIIIHLVGYDITTSRPAFDLSIQAETGYMYLNRQPGQMPMKFPFAFTDVMAGYQIRSAALMALYNREKNSDGCYITVSLYQSGIAGLINQASYFLMTGEQPEPLGSLHPTIAPYGEVFESADGRMFTIAIGTDDQFNALTGDLELPDAYDHNQFSSNVLRVKNRELLFGYLSDSFKLLNWNALERLFLRKNVPFGLVANMNQVFQNQLAKQMIRESEGPEGKIKTVSTVAFKVKG